MVTERGVCLTWGGALSLHEGLRYESRAAGLQHGSATRSVCKDNGASWASTQSRRIGSAARRQPSSGAADKFAIYARTPWEEPLSSSTARLTSLPPPTHNITNTTTRALHVPLLQVPPWIEGGDENPKPPRGRRSSGLLVPPGALPPKLMYGVSFDGGQYASPPRPSDLHDSLVDRIRSEQASDTPPRPRSSAPRPLPIIAVTPPVCDFFFYFIGSYDLILNNIPF